MVLGIACPGWARPLSADILLSFTAGFRNMEHRAGAPSRSVCPGTC